MRLRNSLRCWEMGSICSSKFLSFLHSTNLWPAKKKFAFKFNNVLLLETHALINIINCGFHSIVHWYSWLEVGSALISSGTFLSQFQLLAVFLCWACVAGFDFVHRDINIYLSRSFSTIVQNILGVCHCLMFFLHY